MGSLCFLLTSFEFFLKVLGISLQGMINQEAYSDYFIYIYIYFILRLF